MWTELVDVDTLCPPLAAQSPTCSAPEWLWECAWAAGSGQMHGAWHNGLQNQTNVKQGHVINSHVAPLGLEDVSTGMCSCINSHRVLGELWFAPSNQPANPSFLCRLRRKEVLYKDLTRSNSLLWYVRKLLWYHIADFHGHYWLFFSTPKHVVTFHLVSPFTFLNTL